MVRGFSNRVSIVKVASQLTDYLSLLVKQGLRTGFISIHSEFHTAEPFKSETRFNWSMFLPVFGLLHHFYNAMLQICSAQCTPLHYGLIG